MSEHNETQAFFNYCRPTFLDAWAPALLRHAPKTHLLYPTAAQTARLADPSPWRGMVWAMGDPQIGPLIDELDALIRAEFDGRAFVRTQIRSPKDAPLFRTHAGRSSSAWVALNMLRESARFYDDHAWLTRQHAPLVIAVRSWLSIPAWAQFRCIIRGRKVVGLSQLAGQSRVPEPMHSRPEHLKRFLLEFCDGWLDALHIANTVADVALHDQTDGARTELKATLLELNPYHRSTSPGLFCWNAPRELDGSLRIVP